MVGDTDDVRVDAGNFEAVHTGYKAGRYTVHVYTLARMRISPDVLVNDKRSGRLMYTAHASLSTEPGRPCTANYT